ncbi:hypothetical protein HYC85_012204 [Camellia sinensis]|uniref:non-specific serine/threonine protein kinase n=1 Tax=Camellia sinensis TaxID=4442 RepID=A0A7J7HDD6_CAMSI|nr:hypothetical protein HYC85_012204 [Camellia sinensis]
MPALLFLFLSLLPLIISQNQEVLFLHQVKLRLSDPNGVLSNWNDHDDTPCNWTSVTCNPLTSSVISVDLSNSSLSGPFPIYLCRLSSLSSLSLFNNNINSSLPLTISTCRNLTTLNLAQNLLTGLIPYTFSLIPNLRYLNLAGNSLSGDIPATLGLFRRLETLILVNNLLDGTIPAALSNMTTLKSLQLAYNPFTPSRLCSGTREPFELSRLTNLDVSSNMLSGSIPSVIFELKSIVQIELFNNSFSGELPLGWSNLTALRRFDASLNGLVGTIPDELCKLPLESLNLCDNQLVGLLPENITGSPNLYDLRVFNNRLYGSLPSELGKNSPLQTIDVSGNQFSGEIPASLCEKGVLEHLALINNLFSGTIPDVLGKCRTLNRVRLRGNRFSGEVPAEFWGLPHVNLLDLGIQSLMQLNELNLANNRLSGKIPDEIGSLPVLNYLDLSQNHFSGKIPLDLQNLKLNMLNLSYNDLSGHIPPLYAKDFYRDSFLGNLGLCGDLPGICTRKTDAKNHTYLWILGSIFTLAGMVFVVGIVWFLCKFWNFRKTKKGISMLKWRSFHKLGFSESEILDCLDEDDVIGSGASGKVYKVELGNGELVAVKKLNERSKKNYESFASVDSQKDAFEAEVETLGRIRHKNIVRLLCCCNTEDCKLLVYEYMPNGSLGDFLHIGKCGLLDWSTRFKIALDAAEGLSYLHHDCVPSIVHRDIKSNNILLDAEFGARISDFGVAKIINTVNKGAEPMSAIAGSCGYIAPEYAYTLRVNEKSDIYSFGVVILELLTGKKPIDPEFGEKDLVTWVRNSLDPKGVEHVLDPSLGSSFKEQISRVLDIGLLCVSPLPINRPSMRKVVKMLQEAGAGAGNNPRIANKDGKLSPYYYEDCSDQGSVI